MKTLKTKVHEWIYSLYEQYSINDREKVLLYSPLYFCLEGFADENMIIYIKATHEGLEFGYLGTEWNGHDPCPFLFKNRIVNWKDLEFLNIKEQQEVILNQLIKTINSRKRQYRKCQFCNEKFPREHRFDTEYHLHIFNDFLNKTYCSNL